MAYALFQVSLKALVWSDDKLLVLRSGDGCIDFPGGRIDNDEISTARTGVLARELAEELGANIRCDLGDVAFVSTRTYKFDGIKNNVLVIFFETTYLEGSVNISKEHESYEWVDPVQLLLDSSIFKSKDEFLQFSNYISKK